MTFDQETEGSTEIITISEPTSFLAATLVALSMMVLAATGLVVAVKPVPYVLIGLMLVSSVMVARLAYRAAQSIWGTTLRLDPEGIAIERLFDKSAYPWHEVADVRLVYSGGMLNDNPRSEHEDRLAVGLFLKGGLAGGTKDREPDIVLCGGSRQFAPQLDRLTETIKRTRARHSANSTVQQARARVAPQSPEFRRRVGGRPSAAPGGSPHFAPAAKVPFGKRPD